MKSQKNIIRTYGNDVSVFWWHVEKIVMVQMIQIEHIGRLARMRFLDTEVDGSNTGNSMLCPWARGFIRIASVDSAVKWVPGGDNLMKDVQCYELFGGIALKNHSFSIFFLFSNDLFEYNHLNAFDMKDWFDNHLWH